MSFLSRISSVLCGLVLLVFFAAGMIWFDFRISKFAVHATQVDIQVTSEKSQENESSNVQELELAASTSATSSATNFKSNFVFQKEQLRDEIAEVRRTLNGQLAEYRTASQAFTIAQGQFQQLNTLSSLETAVQATRTAYEKRAMVLRTYLQLLRLELLQNNGVDLEFREYALEGIDLFDAALNRHIDQTRLALDRQSIAVVANDFEELSPLLQTHIHISRQILQQGRYQAVADALQSLLTSLQLETQDLTNEDRLLQTSQDERALQQIQLRLDEVQSTLDLAELEIEKAISPDARKVDLNIEQQISSAFAGFRQVVAFIRELL